MLLSLKGFIFFLLIVMCRGGEGRSDPLSTVLVDLLGAITAIFRESNTLQIVFTTLLHYTGFGIY